MYSGCGGNGNKFMLLEECMVQCEERSKDCSNPKVIGPCENFTPYYYYNKKTGKCEKFLYGGCDGNRNRFKMLSECKIQCERSSDKCSDPKKVGLCKAYFPRYYYNAQTRKCIKFIYGGCGANGNNFLKLNDCIAHCERSSKPK
ncbi:actinia tenebrosa protease inhibitors-like isoform X2 [Hemitrygon akajei]